MSQEPKAILHEVLHFPSFVVTLLDYRLSQGAIAAHALQADEFLQ